jgi:phospholipid transport system substrate-binding protein
MRKTLFSTIVTALLLLGFSASALAAESPRKRVEEGVGEIVELLKDGRLQDNDKREAALEDISKLSDKYFDYKYLAMMAVGRPWLEMDDNTRDELTKVFRKVLELNYLPKLEGYSGQKINYVKEMVRGDKAMVITEVIDKDKKISVNYRLVKMNGVWMVYDIIAEGISLVKNYRTQFAEILHDGDAQTLIEKLRQKAKELEAAQRAENGN